MRPTPEHLARGWLALTWLLIGGSGAGWLIMYLLCGAP